MDRMQISHRLLNSHQIFFAEAATYVHITRQQGHTVNYGSKSADKHKFHMALVKPLEDVVQIIHAV